MSARDAATDDFRHARASRFASRASSINRRRTCALLDLQWAAPVAKGTVGIRLPITRFHCKVKMSQDKDPETQRQVIQALRAPGAYHNPRLADEMERALASG
jgi:predicted FMN-binding regulatory protein PaiB